MNQEPVSYTHLSSVLTDKPVRISASGILGVMRVPMGSNFASISFSAREESSSRPLVDTITGSITILPGRYCFSLCMITSNISSPDTMPIFTASGKISENTQSSWAAIKSGPTSEIAYTPVVFCAVSEVMTALA